MTDPKTYEEIVDDYKPSLFLLFVSSYRGLKTEDRVKVANIFNCMLPSPVFMLITKNDVVECDASSLAHNLGAHRFDFEWKDIKGMCELYKNDMKEYKKLFLYYYLEEEQKEFLRLQDFTLINLHDDSIVDEILKHV